MVFKRGIKFLLHKRKATDTKGLAIRMRVTIQGETPVDFPTGVCVDSEFWDSENFTALDGFIDRHGNTTDSINETISKYKQAALDAVARYDFIEKRKTTKNEIKVLINDITGRKLVFDESELPSSKPLKNTLKRLVNKTIGLNHRIRRITPSRNTFLTWATTWHSMTLQLKHCNHS